LDEIGVMISILKTRVKTTRHQGKRTYIKLTLEEADGVIECLEYLSKNKEVTADDGETGGRDREDDL